MARNSNLLAIDARWMIGNYRGMGRHAFSLIRPICNDVIEMLPQNKYQSKISKRSVLSGISFYPWWEQVILPKLCRQYQVSHLICPYNTAPLIIPDNIKLILVVHDLIYLESWWVLPPSLSLYQTLGRIYRRYIVPRIIERADKLITVSEYTKEQIAEKFLIPKDSIHVIPPSLGPLWYEHVPIIPECRKPYMLCVAGEAPSKNLQKLLLAFAKLKIALGRDGEAVILRVVGVGKAHHQYFQKYCESNGLGSSVKFEVFVEEGQLRKLYREAWLFAMPSLMEGFGIPLLEAMASGTPIACSNTTSLPEVAGGAGWFFDPSDVSDMAEKIYFAWTDSSERSKRANIGLVRAKLYRNEVINELVDKFWGRQ